MIKCFCDKCKKECDEYIPLEVNSYNYLKRWHICKDCYNQLLVWLDDKEIIQDKQQNNNDVSDIKVSKEPIASYHPAYLCCPAYSNQNEDNQTKDLATGLLIKAIKFLLQIIM